MIMCPKNFADRSPSSCGLRLTAAVLPLTLASLVSPGLSAQETASAASCTLNARNEAVVVLVCPVDSTDEDWQAAGREACKDGSACNAWIWLDASAAPSEAPATDAELPKELAAKASAVWIADTESLMTIRPAP